MDRHVRRRGFAPPLALLALAMTYVEEISRHWHQTTNGAGDIMLVLVAVEIVYYVVKTVVAVWKWIKGQRRLVREERNEWRSYTRERVVATYRPDNDPKHPNYRGRTYARSP